MKGVQLTKMAQELNLTNLTPDIDFTDIYIKTAEINRPALQLTGYLEHFANERDIHPGLSSSVSQPLP